MATHSSTLAWKILWTEEPSRLQSLRLDSGHPYYSHEKYGAQLFSRVQLFATPWTVAYQAPPSMGFSRREYWSGVPLPSPTTPTATLQKWYQVY